MNHFDMAELGKKLNFKDSLFITRENGERAYPYLTQHITQLPEDKPLVLVFPPGQLLDASFVDECIVRLGEELMDGNFGHKAILLQGLTDNSIMNIKSVISLRQLKLGLLVIEIDGQWKWIGHLESSLEEVLNLVSERHQLTAPELSDAMNLAINTASNRLKRLYDRHLVWREHEITDKGLQYIYKFWEWAE